MALDLALGVTWLGGALVQGGRAVSSGEASLALVAALAPSLIAGAIVLGRAPARGAGWREVAAAAPSLALPLLLPLWVPPPARWPALVVVVFGVGAALSCWALLALGRSFAVLAAPRPVVRRGPYRFVRHPLYAGELLMWAAACALLPTAVAVGLVVAAIAALALRIRAEEQVLGRDPMYRAYAAAVPGRLVPRGGYSRS